METNDWKHIAAQLRKPNGDFASEIGNRMNDSNEQINLFTIEALQAGDDMEILEIGMGNGKFVNTLLKGLKNTFYTGIDYSSEMVSESKANNKVLCENGIARFLNLPIDELPYSGPLFDRIFSINTLYFWDEPEKTIFKIRQLLNPGGRLVISIRPKHVMENHPFVEYGFKLFDRSQVCTLIESNMLEIVDVIEKKEHPVASLGNEPMQFESLIVCASKKP